MSSEIPEPSYQTISFPTGAGSPSLCARCSSLLSYFITYYGDGTGYEDVKIVHSPSSSQIPDESIDNVNIDAKWNETYEIDNSRTSLCCVICIKSEMLFDAARTHVSFESSLKHTPREEWSLDWHLQVLDPKLYPAAAFPRDHLRIFVGANHKNGYGWGIGRSIRMLLQCISVKLAF